MLPASGYCSGAPGARDALQASRQQPSNGRCRQAVCPQHHKRKFPCRHVTQRIHTDTHLHLIDTNLRNRVPVCHARFLEGRTPIPSDVNTRGALGPAGDILSAFTARQTADAPHPETPTRAPMVEMSGSLGPCRLHDIQAFLCLPKYNVLREVLSYPPHAPDQARLLERRRRRLPQSLMRVLLLYEPHELREIFLFFEES